MESKATHGDDTDLKKYKEGVSARVQNGTQMLEQSENDHKERYHAKRIDGLSDIEGRQVIELTPVEFRVWRSPISSVTLVG